MSSIIARRRFIGRIRYGQGKHVPIVRVYLLLLPVAARCTLLHKPGATQTVPQFGSVCLSADLSPDPALRVRRRGAGPSGYLTVNRDAIDRIISTPLLTVRTCYYHSPAL